MRGEECCPCTLVDRKWKRYDNTVDVVIRLHDPTDPSTESTDLRDLHMFGSVTSHKLSIQLSVEGELRQHEGVMAVMMMLPSQGFT